MSDMTDRRPSPAARVLCTDARLCRFFEIELAHLGIRVSDPKDGDEALPCLILADTDTHALDAVLQAARAAGCPLLTFGRAEADLPPEAGEYVRRPFTLPALESALRRLLAGTTTTEAPLARTHAPAHRTHADEMLTVDEENATVSAGERRVTLTPAEWAIFRVLYERRGEPVSRAALAACLGGGGNSVDVYICHLRRKIEKPLGRRMIATVRGRGYVLE